MKTFYAILISVFIWMNSNAQFAGTLDTTFSGNGTYTQDFGFQDNLNDVTMQPDQKIICTGTEFSSSFVSSLKVVRLKTDGTLDSGFAVNGVYSLLLGNDSYGFESYVLNNGKILVAGAVYDNNFTADWLLICLEPSGSLDPTFGTNGITTVDFFGNDDLAAAMTVQADGKILVSGTHNDTINFYNNPTIVRFTSNGIVDSTFGTNGWVSVPGLYIDNELTSITVQPDGKIVAGGHYQALFTGGVDFDVFMIRVDSTGVFDPLFGNNGKVITAIGNQIDDSFGLEIDQNGNIFVAGFTTLASTYAMILMKYDNTGTLVPTFGFNGIAMFNNANENVAYDLKIQADNKILVGGSSGPSLIGAHDFAIWRYLPSGVLDNTFGSNGLVITPVLPNFQDCNSIVLQADGKIVAAGRASNGSQNDIAVVRYLNDVTTSLQETRMEQGMLLYPNPVLQNGVITLQSENNLQQNIICDLYSISGSKIASMSAMDSYNEHSLQYKLPSFVSQGIYFIVLANGSSSTTHKLIVE